MQSIYNADPQKIIVVMVGLPARGKSYISKKIYRFLNWLGFNAQVFNIGNYRRKYMADHGIQLKNDFFDVNNKEASQIRAKIASICLQDLISYISKPQNKVAIFDGTNTTKERRKYVDKHLKETIKQKYQLIWIESICDDIDVINQNIKKVKVHGLDFVGKNQEEATQDFNQRIQKYQKIYEPLQRSQGYSYIKTINVGAGVEINKINGYLPEKIMTYTINLTISPNRNIYLSRHGQSQYNIDDRVGGDPSLSENGRKYAKILPGVLDALISKQEQRDNLTIITSTLKRTVQTAEKININNKKKIQLRILDQINAGICQTLTYEEIRKKYPQIYKEREHEKLKFRYPSGESYLDVIGRLQPLIYWIQRQKHSVLVIGHQAIIRCISAYFFNINLNQLPFIPVPLHKLIRLIPQTYTFKEEYVNIDLQSGQIVEIHRPVRKKFSIDEDGSNNIHGNQLPKMKRGFKSVKSVL